MFFGLNEMNIHPEYTDFEEIYDEAMDNFLMAEKELDLARQTRDNARMQNNGHRLRKKYRRNQNSYH